MLKHTRDPLHGHSHTCPEFPLRSMVTQFSYLLASGVATMPRGFQTLVLGCSPGLAIRVVWSSEGLASSLPWGYRLCVLTLSQAGTPGSAHPTLGSGPHAAGVHTGSCPISQPDSPVSFDKAETKRYLAPLMRPPKFPDIPVSLEGNTKVHGTTSCEPLHPS